MPELIAADRVASRAEVMARRADLGRLAIRHGLDHVRVTADGVLIAHVQDPSYRPVIRFSLAAAELLGAHVQVITDDVPAAAGAVGDGL